MKRLQCLLFILLAAGYSNVFAQAPAAPLQQYYDNAAISFDSSVDLSIQLLSSEYPNDTAEGGVGNAFKKWMFFWGDRVSNDTISSLEKHEPVNTAYQYYLTTLHSIGCSTNGFNGDWNCIGPFNDYFDGVNGEERQGRIDQIWVDPADTNYILLGSNGGGIWKTVNGGRSWKNITDGAGLNNLLLPGTLGITGLAVNPLDHDMIFASTGIFTLADVNSWAYGVGMIYSLDGGQSWQEELNFQQASGGKVGVNTEKIKFKPGTEELIALYGKTKVFYNDIQSYNWRDITPTTLPAGLQFNDFEYSLVDPDKVVFAANNTSLWIYDISTDTWSSTGVISPSGASLTSVGISNISLSNQDTVFALVPLSNLAVSLWKSPVGIWNWVQVNSNIGDRIINIEVSPSNADVIYFGSKTGGSPDGFYSTDGGQSRISMANNVHADVRTIYIYSTVDTADGLRDVVYAGTDGGIVKKRNGATQYISITGDSLCVTQFFGMSSSESNGDVIIGGAQDNGAFNYVKDRAAQWRYTHVGDGYLAKMAPNGRLDGIVENNYPSLHRTNFSASITNPTTTWIGNPADAGCGSFEPCANALRPVVYNIQSGTAYIGYKEIYKDTSMVGSGWIRAFQNDPKDPDNDPINKKVATFAFAKQDTNMVYVAYRRESGGNHADTPFWHNPRGKLYVSTNAFDTSSIIQNPVVWKNITPEYVSSYRINDITIDPLHPERIWVALGNVDWFFADKYSVYQGDTVKRVLYSPDTGNTWINVSVGLPALPANKIEYMDGSDDVLFLATDVGVFKWDKDDQQWYCFNDGMPANLVLDIEINYCSGKLRAGTYGRGIWETPIFDNSYIPDPSNVITSNTTWGASRTLHSGIRIKNGATLTIQNTAPNQTTIFMPRNGNIIVEPGAKLVVNGARITNGCEDCMWDGIRVVGVYNQPQTIAYQGVVELNGAIIEHAKVAVGNYDITGHPHFSTGGIIKAENTHFLNNATSVSLEPYTDRTGSPFLQNYQAKFTTCTFEIDDDFKGGNDNKFTAHVNLRQVSGVSFLGADFLNNAANALKGEGDGIRTHSAGFTLKAWCDPFIFPCTYVRNRFSGLRTGVYMGLDISGRLTSCEIDRSDFDSCSVGIFSNGQHHFVATRDSFRMGYGKTTDLDAFDCDKNIGIWTQNAWSPVIEDNSFVGFTHGGQEPTHQNIGTVTDNSSEHNNRIYNNTFHDLHRASIARGRNSDGIVSARGSQNGLRYLCNTYDDNNYDIEVMDLGTVTTHQAHTIAYSQGSFVQSAGNQFPDRSSFFHIQDVSTWGGFKYYHTTGNTVPQMPANTNVWPFMSLSGNTCVSQYDPGGGGITFPMSTSSLNDVKASYHDAASARLVLMGDLDGYIDGGNTADLLNYVNTSAMADSPTVRTTLLGYSPYLSKDVLMATASAAILPQSVLMEILQANPDVLRDGELLEHLAGIPVPLTGPQIEELQTTAYNSTARTELLGDIADLSAEMGRASSIVLNHYLLDTVTTERDSIPVWLDHIHTPEAEYSKVAFYTSLGDYTTAASLISGITTKFSMGTEQEQERDLFQELWTLMKDVYEDGRTARELTEGEITQLEGIGEDPIATGRLIGTQVQVILDEPINQFRLPCNLPEPASSEGKPGRRNSIAVNGTASSGNIIKAYPNPASDFIIFEYDIPKASGKLSIVVTGITGQKTAVLEPEQPRGRSQLDTRSLPAGVYLYKLYDGSRQVGVGRIVIAK